MSVFQVNLDQGLGLTADGALDTAISGGFSIQRTIYAAGPNKINRELFDGQTFTDVNYWKRYCATPVGPLSANEAFLTIISDDGSVWNDFNPAENVFPRSFAVSVAGNASQLVNILASTGGYAIFTQISLTSASTSTVTLEFNGLSNATMVLDLTTAITTQVFDAGDLALSTINISNASGGGTVTGSIFCSIALQPNS